jgi:hypothetical protein
MLVPLLSLMNVNQLNSIIYKSGWTNSARFGYGRFGSTGIPWPFIRSPRCARRSLRCKSDGVTFIRRTSGYERDRGSAAGSRAAETGEGTAATRAGSTTTRTGTAATRERRLKRQLEEAQRANKRQAAPFSRRQRKENRKNRGVRAAPCTASAIAKPFPTKLTK